MTNRFQIIGKKFQIFSRKAVRYCHNASRVLKKNKDGNQVLWSELDENLLAEIMSRLSLLSDQVCFHAVCKRWHSIRPITPCTTSLPWFVGIEIFPSSPRSMSFTYRLYEPYSSTKFRISTCKISLSKLLIPRSFPMNITCTLGHSWFFISVCQTNSSGDHTNFFVFSLLTKKLIQLPKLHNYSIMSLPGFIHRFSTNPDSPDCVFLISYIGDEPEFVIMTCRQGDKEWTARKFDNFMRGSCIAEYINGAFYIVSVFGQVASYNIMNWEYEIEKLDEDDDFDQLFDSQMGCSMFELNGDIIILYYTFPGIPCIKKFDWCTKAWVPLESLGDQTVLVGSKINGIAKVGMEQARNIGVLLNAIYYYSDNWCIVYSFENGALVQLGSWVNTEKSGDLLHLHYSSVIRDKNHICYWMESPFIW